MPTADSSEVRARIDEILSEKRTAHDVPELAAMLGKTDRTVRRMLRDGEIEYYKLGGRIYVTDRALLDYLEHSRTRRGAAVGARKRKSA